jgi:hypothetical protein
VESSVRLAVLVSKTPLKCASSLPLCPSHIHIRTGHTVDDCFFAYHSESDSDMEAEDPGVYFDELPGDLEF